ncbi:hypothetical protein K2X85_10530 [bacterium]|nr:hypothetical protein [bacterium]
MSESRSNWPQAFYWWIDAVGSYLVYTQSQIRIGQAGGTSNDISILGDLRAHHADLMIGSAGTVLIPRGEATVNGQTGESFLLHHGDIIRLRRVELTYFQPQPWSRTARLVVSSRHRLDHSVDGIILLGETAVLGPKKDAIIRTEWEHPLFLNWYQNRYWIRGPEELLVDQKRTGGCAGLEPNSQIEGSWGSFRWEPIQTR